MRSAASSRATRSNSASAMPRPAEPPAAATMRSRCCGRAGAAGVRAPPPCRHRPGLWKSAFCTSMVGQKAPGCDDQERSGGWLLEHLEKRIGARFSRSSVDRSPPRHGGGAGVRSNRSPSERTWSTVMLRASPPPSPLADAGASAGRDGCRPRPAASGGRSGDEAGRGNRQAGPRRSRRTLPPRARSWPCRLLGPAVCVVERAAGQALANCSTARSWPRIAAASPTGPRLPRAGVRSPARAGPDASTGRTRSGSSAAMMRKAASAFA